MADRIVFTLDEVLELLPHRAPFLFVDRIVAFEPGKRIIGERDLRADEPFFAGHFPGRPVMPGVLITDALAQTSGLLWGFTKRETDQDGTKGRETFYLAAANMKYVGPSYPGDTLVLDSRMENSFGALYSYRVEAFVGRKTVARGALTLAMADEGT